MGIPSPVEELAGLVKDNLHAKHLVLSVEELFVEFLECPSSPEEPLALEPMVSYQRMLLHRLADLFGLAHESVGEGDDRHLVVEKCEESLIPAVLVSDVLEAAAVGAPHVPSSRQLLKRDTLPADGFQTPRTSNSFMSSFEDRQAAYVAARQRIFSGSGTWKSSKESFTGANSGRPKSDPLVARRMIAHALGRPARLALTDTPTRSASANDLDMQSLGGRIEGTSCEGGSKIWSNEPAHSSSSLQESSFRAAKRLFSNALGVLQPGMSPRGSLRSASSESGPANLGSREDPASENAPPRVRSVSCNLSTSGARGKRAGVSPLNAAGNCPGIAARRIFAQALGLPDPACARDINSPA